MPTRSAFFPVELLSLIKCRRDARPLIPTSRTAVASGLRDGEVRCLSCGASYAVVDGMLDLLGDDAPRHADSAHELRLRDGVEPIQRGVAGWRPTWQDAAEISATTRLLNYAPTEPALELGCGPGVYTRALALTGRPVVAVDFSWTALRHNRDQLPGGARVGLVRADVAQLRVASARFSLALNTAYSNLPSDEIRHACNLMVRDALSPGGRYVVSAHRQDARRILKQLPRTGEYRDGGVHYECFTTHTLAEELDAFDLVSIRPAVVELPLISRIPSHSLRRWLAVQGASVPGVNAFGSILLAVATPASLTTIAPRVQHAM